MEDGKDFELKANIFTPTRLDGDKPCAVYISCENAMKLKNKLEEFKENKVWFNYQKIIRLKRYLNFVINFLVSYIDEDKSETIRVGFEKMIRSILFIDVPEYIKFWLDNINYLISICGLDDITEISQEIVKAIIASIHKLKNNKPTKLGKNMPLHIISLKADYVDATTKLSSYISILKKILSFIPNNDNEKLITMLNNNNPIFDDLYDYHNGGDIIEVIIKKNNQLDNKGCITQLKTSNDGTKFIVTYYTTFVKKLIIEEFDIKQLCIKDQKKYDECSKYIDKDQEKFTMTPDQQKFIFYLKSFTNDSDCEINISQENLNNLKNKIAELKNDKVKPNDKNEYNVGNSIEIEYNQFSIMNKKKNNLSTKITYINPKKKYFKTEKKIRIRKSILGKSLFNFNSLCVKKKTIEKPKQEEEKKSEEKIAAIIKAADEEPKQEKPKQEEIAAIIKAADEESKKLADTIEINSKKRIKTAERIILGTKIGISIPIISSLSLGSVGIIIAGSIALIAEVAYFSKKFRDQNMEFKASDEAFNTKIKADAEVARKEQVARAAELAHIEAKVIEAREAREAKEAREEREEEEEEEKAKTQES